MSKENSDIIPREKGEGIRKTKNSISITDTQSMSLKQPSDQEVIIFLDPHDGNSAPPHQCIPSMISLNTLVFPYVEKISLFFISSFYYF